MADVFISYKKLDRDRITPLITGLEQLGFTVWWDYEIEVGGDWFQRILQEIDKARCVIGVWTVSAINERGLFIPNDEGRYYVRNEHEQALKPVARLIPVLLDPDRIPIEYNFLQAANLVNWNGDINHPEFQKLAARVEELATPSWVRRRYAEREERVERAARELEEAQGRIEGLRKDFEAVRRSHAETARQLEEARGERAAELAEAQRQRAAEEAAIVAAREEAARAEARRAAAAQEAAQQAARVADTPAYSWSTVASESKTPQKSNRGRTLVLSGVGAIVAVMVILAMLPRPSETGAATDANEFVAQPTPPDPAWAQALVGDWGFPDCADPLVNLTLRVEDSWTLVRRDDVDGTEARLTITGASVDTFDVSDGASTSVYTLSGEVLQIREPDGTVRSMSRCVYPEKK